MNAFAYNFILLSFDFSSALYFGCHCFDGQLLCTCLSIYLNEVGGCFHSAPTDPIFYHSKMFTNMFFRMCLKS